MQITPISYARPLFPFTTAAAFSLLLVAGAMTVSCVATATPNNPTTITTATIPPLSESLEALKAEELYLVAPTLENRRTLLTLLLLTIEDHPDDLDLLWRLARAHYDVLNANGTPREEVKTLTYDAFAIIQKALELLRASPDPSLRRYYAIHKWYGIILSLIGELEGTKKSIANSFIIKDHFQEAAELNPKDATTQHLLGRWSLSIAEISWVQRKVAATLFSDPPEATYQQALAYFLKAEAVDPGFWKKNNLMIATLYLKLKETALATIWLKKTLTLPNKTEEDLMSHQSALDLLKGLESKK